MKFTSLSMEWCLLLLIKTDRLRRNSRLDNANREKMRHLRCLCFVRPSSDSIQFLIDEFRDPKYGQYNICQPSRYFLAYLALIKWSRF